MAEPRHLKRLNELDDFMVAGGDPDPRGWDVTGADGREIGHVRDLLVDTTAMKARYLDVEVDGGESGSSTDERHLLVPVDAVAIGREERENKRVSVPLSAAAARRAGESAASSHVDGREACEWPRAHRDAGDARFTPGGHSG